MKKQLVKLGFFGATALLPNLALAHSGHGSHGFFSGLLHPITGIDHLVMLLAFGLLAGSARLSKLQTLSVLCVAVMMMVIGFVSTYVMASPVVIESAVIASLFMMSVALWLVFSASKKTLHVLFSVCLGMMFFHGYAHGIEVQGTASLFATGMAMSAVIILLLGLTLSKALASRWAALLVASTGTVFALAI